MVTELQSALINSVSRLNIIIVQKVTLNCIIFFVINFFVYAQTQGCRIFSNQIRSTRVWRLNNDSSAGEFLS